MNAMKVITERLINYVIKESEESGSTTSYFRDRPDWEGTMRTDFEKLIKMIGNGASENKILETAIERLRILNNMYNCRFPVVYIPEVIKVIIEHIKQLKRLTNDSDVLICNDNDLLLYFSNIPTMLETIRNISIDNVPRKAPRPYSLLTKYLHFCFPNTYPIYDKQAALSIQMWSYMAFENRTINGEWANYQVWEIADTTGDGYFAIIDFYRNIWNLANDEQKNKLKLNAEFNSKIANGKVSVLDLIDKVLWRASGDPLLLGLLSDHPIR